MEDFKGKTAFISGGASGIGLAMAKQFLGVGMQVIIADIRQDALNKAVAALDAGTLVRALMLDVTNRKNWQIVSDEIDQVDIVCSNAGVFLGGPAQDATYDDWDFVLGVNLQGTINCVQTFVPRMIAQKTGGHIVLTSSINGLFQSGGAAVYTTSKFAVTGLGESLRVNLEPHKIGVSLLHPGPIATDLFASTPQVRPKHLRHTGAYAVQLDETDPVSSEIFATAMSADEVGRKVLAGIRRNDLYIITHAEIRNVLEARAKALLAALPDEPIPPVRAKGAATLYSDQVYQEQIAKPAPKPE